MAIVLAGAPSPLLPMTRARHVRALSPVLPGLGVTITPAEDGQVSIRLPAEVAELFLCDLEQRAQEWQAAMQKARLQESERQAVLRAHSEATRQRVEAQEDAWAAEYDRLWAEGRGHQEILHIIRGPDTPEAPLLDTITMGIQFSKARQRTRDRHAREAEIRRLAEEGLSRREIADRLRLNYAMVQWVVRRAGVPVQPRRRGQQRNQIATAPGQIAGK